MTNDSSEVTRAEVAARRGPMLLEFGAAWCGYCRALAPVVQEIHAAFPQVEHWKIEDGPGKPLGRSFRVTLWPTLVFLRDGEVVRQMARPGRSEVLEGFRAVTATGDGMASDPLSIGQITPTAGERAAQTEEQRSGSQTER